MARQTGRGKKGGGKKGGGGTVTDARDPRVRVKTARGRKLSSTRWLDRQLNDPYVAEAKRRGYRGRAAFKLAEIDDKHGILKPGARIVDLGCAPGGWTQVALERCGKQASVVWIDLLECDPIAGATLLVGDFMEDEAPARLHAALDGKADAVLSDMAANTTGHARTDHLRIVALAETAYDFARQVLAPGGSFVAKVFAGGTEAELLGQLKRDFRKVFHMKPPASRKESAEMYVVAIGFRAAEAEAPEAR
jgi:23S rRNA (uridine2552-2'-O)-methyltransferase